MSPSMLKSNLHPWVDIMGATLRPFQARQGCTPGRFLVCSQHIQDLTLAKMFIMPEQSIRELKFINESKPTQMNPDEPRKKCVLFLTLFEIPIS